MTSILLTVLLNILQEKALPGGCSAASSLTVRNAHAMAFDGDREVVLLFGGADDRRVLGDLWAWNGDRWRCLSDEGPPPRTFPALAYDAARSRLVLFGGNRVLFGSDDEADTFLDDMWTWDGRLWRRIGTETPPPRAEASMVYDAARERIVLFGGHRRVDGERIRLGDTWEWDGKRWERKSVEVPPPRNGTAMAYDAHRKRVVLFGGSGASSETWEWDGQAWEQVQGAKTEGRFNSAMAYDAIREAVIRFGGWTRHGRVGDTWRYDGTRWTKIADDGPAGRNHTSLVWDDRRGVAVLFGGHDGDRVFGDTWEWDGERWKPRTELSPRPRVDNGH